MQEKRTQPRIAPDAHLAISDSVTGEMVGNLINISTGGFMLMTDHALPTGNLFQLEISLPDNFGGRDHISLGAESLWIQERPATGHFWMGFQIIDIAEGDKQLIESLIASWRK